VEVAPERLEQWFDGFAERHGELRWSAGLEQVKVAAADGSAVECAVPFPPLLADTQQQQALSSLVAHCLRERRVGVVLVRLGGFAAGVFAGPQLVAAKVGSRPVHGRSAAGGWSQHRFARRREGQANVALQAAADVVCRIVLPLAATLDAVVAGGDRRAVDTVLGDPRLAALLPLLTPPLLDVPTPDRRVLQDSYQRFRSVSLRVTETQAEG
jgi:hypothetical protein